MGQKKYLHRYWLRIFQKLWKTSNHRSKKLREHATYRHTPTPYTHIQLTENQRENLEGIGERKLVDILYTKGGKYKNYNRLFKKSESQKQHSTF